jgi:GNAT superfamily N-acetyltransferase
MLKATHKLSKIEKQQMQHILNQYTSNQGLLGERLSVIEEDYVMDPYYLYYQEDRVIGFVLIEFVEDDLLQAKIYMEQVRQMDLLLQQIKSHLRQSGIKTVLFCMEEELDLLEVQSLTLNSCDYKMECLHEDFLSWSGKRKGTKARVRWMAAEDELFYKKTLEEIFLMGCKEREDRFLSLLGDLDCISNGSFVKQDCMAGLILETMNKDQIGIGGCYIGNRCISLFDIAIIKKSQDQGYGSELMYWIYEITKHLEKDYLLQVSSDNKKAVALYQSIGFKIQEQLYCYQLDF